MADLEPQFANETTGVNVIPFASMAGGWMAPMLIFWLNVWGPLRPFHYPSDHLAPSLPIFAALALACVAAWWLPPSYYRVHSFERSGRIYEGLGVRFFRSFVPDPWFIVEGPADRCQAAGRVLRSFVKIRRRYSGFGPKFMRSPTSIENSEVVEDPRLVPRMKRSV